jgi:hypothetical protein
MAAHEAQQLVAYLSHEDVGLVQVSEGVIKGW